ncbi:hypothetical protein TWF281_007045 [Arthrobotrys megalospora]
MDFVKKFTEGNEGEQRPTATEDRKEGGSFFDKASGFINEQAGGGQKGEQKEDMLDKGIDYVQEKYLGQGPQDNESAAEQAKDEAISDCKNLSSDMLLFFYSFIKAQPGLTSGLYNI